MIVGIAPISTGAGGELIGVALDGTVVLAPAGIPTAAASAGLIGYGGTATYRSVNNYFKDASDLISNITKGGSNAHPNGTFENADYHGKTNNSIKNKAPNDGQAALDNSVSLNSETTPRRVGTSDGEIVVLDQTSEGIFHEHVRSWDELTPKMRSVLQKAGLVDKKGNVIK